MNKNYIIFFGILLLLVVSVEGKTSYDCQQLSGSDAVLTHLELQFVVP